MLTRAWSLCKLYAYTIIDLRLIQIFYRFKFSFRLRAVDNLSGVELKCREIQPLVAPWNGDHLSAHQTFCIFNRHYSLFDIGWSNTTVNVEKLWRYHQNYFNFINFRHDRQYSAWCANLILDWVDCNHKPSALTWDPYPISIRVVNWIRWHSHTTGLTKTCIKSLVSQVRWLRNHLEWHLLANHLFSNAKALVFAGCFFEGQEAATWLRDGLKIIREQLAEQILSDGGHFERSPMYHCAFLVDILDLINLAKNCPQHFSEKDVCKWVEVSHSVWSWAEAMTHPDGGIVFFNDSTLNHAPSLSDIKEYAARIGVKFGSQPSTSTMRKLLSSGFISLRRADLFLAVNVAPTKPRYQPGHAHADTLSFEASLWGCRLITNSGVSTYENGMVRSSERSSRSHNTVVVDGENSSEVWASFRVARKAQPFDLFINEDDGGIEISCSHDGYKRLSPDLVHRRTFEIQSRQLVISDRVKGTFNYATAYFHFDPSYELQKLSSDCSVLLCRNGIKTVEVIVQTGNGSLDKSFYSPQFFHRVERACLAVDLVDGISQISIRWGNISA